VRRAFAALALALGLGGVLAQWLAPGHVVAWLLAGYAFCG
jgi:hypothetical protein